jgi:OmpA-OmpF porin, OOP family
VTGSLRVPRRSLAGAVVLVVLAGCATQTDRVILLPGADGKSSGAVAVGTAKGELLLKEAYAHATVVGGTAEPGRSSAEQVKADFGELLALQPARPRQWVVYFEPGTQTLTAASLPALAELKAALADVPAGEVIVTGHTDRVGALADNDRLSLARAAAVRELLIAAGVPAERIAAGGRGEREPVVATADEVSEPRNRRVEIKLR